MQGEMSRLYHEYYRFAFDTARKAEQAMKQELMRPGLDTTDFAKFNYWAPGARVSSPATRCTSMSSAWSSPITSTTGASTS